jgi:hypothetical protein
MSCPLLTAWVDGVKLSVMLEVEISAIELIYFVEAVVTNFSFFYY